jgi:hypothetical protein
MGRISILKSTVKTQVGAVAARPDWEASLSEFADHYKIADTVTKLSKTAVVEPVLANNKPKNAIQVFTSRRKEIVVDALP